MATALDFPGLSSQPRQRVGARLLRRIGGAVRNAIADSLPLAGATRRLEASQSTIGHAVDRKADACPVSPHARAPRRSGAASPVRPSRRGWLARLLHRRRPAAPFSRAQFFENLDAPFTPEEFPGLSPEACAFFSTPLEDLDPEILARLLDALASKLADLMPHEAGMTEATALLSTLWRGLDTPLDAASPDAALAAAAPATPPQAVPDAPAIAPDPRAEASSPADELPHVPFPSPAQQLSRMPAEAVPYAALAAPPLAPELPTPDLPPDASIATATSATEPNTASRPGPVTHHACRAWAHRRSLLIGIYLVIQRVHWLFCGCGSRLSRNLQSPPMCHWCYAARASPP
jgi:hypothetical protein